MLRPKYSGMQVGGLTKGLIPKPTYRMSGIDSAGYNDLLQRAQQLGPDAFRSQYINPLGNKITTYPNAQLYLNQLYTRTNALEDSQNVMSKEQVLQELLRPLSKPKDTRKYQQGGPKIDTYNPTINYQPGVDIPLTPTFPTAKPVNKIQDAINKGLIEPQKGFNTAQEMYDFYNAPQERVNNFNPQNAAFGMQAATTGLSFLSGAVDRGRQNQYLYNQLSTLGQQSAMPYEDYQPNPFSLYAKYGGSLRKYQKGGMKKC